MKKTLFLVSVMTLYSPQAFSDDSLTSQVKSFSAENSRLPPPVLPKSEPSVSAKLTLPEGAKPTEGMQSISLFLDEIDVVGLISYSRQDLQKILQRASVAYAGLNPKTKLVKPVVKQGKLKGNYKIVVKSDVLLSYAYIVGEEITKLYQDDSYFLSRAVIPVQEINQKNGVIEICAIEGRISKNLQVITKGETQTEELNSKLKGLKSSIFNRLKKLTQSQSSALKFDVFERQLLLTRDMPGVSISTTFKQPPLNQSKATDCATSLSQGAGVTNLLVAVELDRFSGGVSIDNYGTDSAGPGFLRLNFGVNSQIAYGDRYAFDVNVSSDGEELRNYGITASIPLNSNGTEFKSSYRKGNASPGSVFEALDVDNDTQTIIMSLEHALKRTRRENMSFSVGLTHQNIDTNLLGVEFLRDRVRYISGQFTYDLANNNGGIHYGSIELTQGLDIDNATQEGDILSSRSEAEPVFAKVVGEYTYFKQLRAPSALSVGRLAWVNSLKLQYANQPLYASQEFELGGRNYGRGSDIGVISGDRGIAIKSQLDYEYILGSGTAKVSGFLDYGKAWNLDNSSIGTEDEEGDLTTLGVSFGYKSDNNWHLNLDIAKPIQISGDKDTDAKAYLGVGYKF